MLTVRSAIGGSLVFEPRYTEVVVPVVDVVEVAIVIAGIGVVDVCGCCVDLAGCSPS